MARLREEEIKIQQVEKERRKNQLVVLAKQRGEDAERRMAEFREEAEAKEREAQRRREVATEAERKSRKMAIKFRETQ